MKRGRMLQSALTYARLGWHIVPLRPGQKIPRVKKWQHRATTDEATIREWWGRWPDANIGLACGPSGIVAIDLDVKGAANGLETWRDLKRLHGINDDTVVSLTPSGGMHLLYHASGAEVRNSAGRLGPGVDVRGDGGFIVLPPSELAEGKYYVWEVSAHPSDRQPIALPVELVQLLGAKSSSKPTGSAGDEHGTIPYGRRNTTLTSLGGTMRRRGISEGAIRAALLKENENRCAPPLGEEEVTRIAKSVTRYTPADSEGRTRAFTDQRNAERLVARHGKDLHYCFTWKDWLVWNGRRWVLDRTGEVERRAKDTVKAIYAEAASEEDKPTRKKIANHAMKSESNVRIKAMLDLARSEEGIPVLPEQLDTDPWLLNCLNGTVDLRTGALQEHRREDLITKLARVNYDPEATLPLWDQFLVEAAGPSVAAFLQRAVGYTLTGDTRHEVLFFVHGPEATGKSTFLEAIRSTLGDYGMTADFETFLRRFGVGGPRPDLARLAGARLVVSIEVEDGKELAEGLIKVLTGGDTVTTRFLYSREFEYVPAFKLWLAANAAPRMSPDDGAIWRRILRVPFERTIPKDKRDPMVKATLRNTDAAGPAILAWAVRGCVEWQRQGLGTCSEVEQATQDLREQMDPLKRFIDECCVLKPDAWTASARLREEYEAWASEMGERPASSKDWGDGLHRAGCTPARRSQDGKQVRGWIGIGLSTAGGGDRHSDSH